MMSPSNCILKDGKAGISHADLPQEAYLSQKGCGGDSKDSNLSDHSWSALDKRNYNHPDSAVGFPARKQSKMLPKTPNKLPFKYRNHNFLFVPGDVRFHTQNSTIGNKIKCNETANLVSPTVKQREEADFVSQMELNRGSVDETKHQSQEFHDASSSQSDKYVTEVSNLVYGYMGSMCLSNAVCLYSI